MATTLLVFLLGFLSGSIHQNTRNAVARQRRAEIDRIFIETNMRRVAAEMIGDHLSRNHKPPPA